MIFFQESLNLVRNSYMTYTQGRSQFKLRINNDWSFELTTQHVRKHMATLLSRHFVGEECMASPKNVCVGGY